MADLTDTEQRPVIRWVNVMSSAGVVPSPCIRCACPSACDRLTLPLVQVIGFGDMFLNIPALSSSKLAGNKGPDSRVT